MFSELLHLSSLAESEDVVTKEMQLSSSFIDPLHPSNSCLHPAPVPTSSFVDIFHISNPRLTESDVPGSFGVPVTSYAHKAGRASVFTRWLLQALGKDRLRRCRSFKHHTSFQPNKLVCSLKNLLLYHKHHFNRTHVLDVAGGKGLVSYELTIRYGIKCTVVDPRVAPMSSKLRNRMKKITSMRSSVALAENHNGYLLSHQKPIFPEDSFILDEVWEAIRGGGLPFAHIRKEFAYPFPHDWDDELRDCVRSTQLIVGMHPDQPTADIIDAALAHRISFAVLPCCVFSELFPDRLTPRGETVRTYEELVEFLHAKDPENIQIGRLPFEGRNIVLFRFYDSDSENVDSINSVNSASDSHGIGV